MKNQSDNMETMIHPDHLLILGGIYLGMNLIQNTQRKLLTEFKQKKKKPPSNEGENPTQISAIPIRDADASMITHVEGEVVKVASTDKQTKNQQSSDQETRISTASSQSQRTSPRRPLPPTGSARTPEPTATCCADPSCVIS
mmetsp:Transcript_8696/g.11366  ORF Transcript_8696/g.11366 Transcript_8696/m.11366 type:complete len:142 (+) Transcript_8696:82-507(+)